MGLRQKPSCLREGRAVEIRPHGGRLRAETGGHCPSMGPYATQNFLDPEGTRGADGRQQRPRVKLAGFLGLPGTTRSPVSFVLPVTPERSLVGHVFLVLGHALTD